MKGFEDVADDEPPFGFSTKRVAVMRRTVVAIALLRESWVTVADLMLELDCCERAAKNVIAWVRVHWFLQSRRQPPGDAASFREYRLATPFRRLVRNGACHFACCRDLRGGDDVVIFNGPSSVHMWQHPDADRTQRSAVMSVPGVWALVGRDAPTGSHSMEEALRWVACDARPSEADAYDADHERSGDSEDRAGSTAGLVDGRAAVVASDARERRAPRRRVFAALRCIQLHPTRRHSSS